MRTTAAAIAAFLLALPGAARAAAPIVATDEGRVQGTEADGVAAFEGIPYAAPPVGALRWRAPQPPAPWPGLRQASVFGHDCMQKPFARDEAPLRTTPSEDCLYLNVWRPAGTARNLPVLVWIHGGGFVNGGTSPAIYSGAAIARQGVVVVSANYRLGRFGYFANPALTRADADHGALFDYGTLDQIAALRWVQRDVAAFGGDPHRVTIDGESAGGASVHALLSSPLATGLFARAVIQSGGDGHILFRTPAEAMQAGIAYDATQAIPPDDAKALERLRALPANAVVDGLNMATLFDPPPGPQTYTYQVADGRIAVVPATAYAAGRFAHVPVMIGATSGDLFGPGGPMIRGAREVADELSLQGVPVFLYRFSYVANAAAPARHGSGAAHASDIPFFFATEAARYGAATTTSDREAARLADAYLVDFVKSADPNGPGLPHWPAYGASHEMLDLDTRAGAEATAP